MRHFSCELKFRRSLPRWYYGVGPRRLVPEETAMALRTIRTDFGLSMRTFSTMVGVPAEDLARWEADGGVLKAASAARVERVNAGSINVARGQARARPSPWSARPRK